MEAQLKVMPSTTNRAKLSKVEAKLKKFANVRGGILKTKTKNKVI